MDPETVALWEKLCLDAGLLDWLSDERRTFMHEAWVKVGPFEMHALSLVRGQRLPQWESFARAMVYNARQVLAAEAVAREQFGVERCEWFWSEDEADAKIRSVKQVRDGQEPYALLFLPIVPRERWRVRRFILPADAPVGRFVVLVDAIGDAGHNNITVEPPPGQTFANNYPAYVIATSYSTRSFVRMDDFWVWTD